MEMQGQIPETDMSEAALRHMETSLKISNVHDYMHVYHIHYANSHVQMSSYQPCICQRQMAIP